MSQYQQPMPDLPYPGQQSAPPKKSRGTALVAIIAGIVGALVGAGVTAAAMSGDPTAKAPTGVASQAGTTTPPDTGPSPDPITTPSTEYTPPAPTYGVPVKTDFKLTVKGADQAVLRVRGVQPHLPHPGLLRRGRARPVGDVRGAEFVSTKNSKTKLTAVVTDVLSQ